MAPLMTVKIGVFGSFEKKEYVCKSILMTEDKFSELRVAAKLLVDAADFTRNGAIGIYLETEKLSGGHIEMCVNIPNYKGCRFPYTITLNDYGSIRKFERIFASSFHCVDDRLKSCINKFLELMKSNPWA